ncbi:MAG: sugar phosphate nucleotidyltransferase [Solirubrobacteraceae bacterium]
MILAGGLAQRLRPLTERLPKALVPVAGRPFADHQLAWLASQGITHVVFAIGYLGGAIRDFVGTGDSWGLSVRFSDEGEELRGTGGALRLAYDEGLLQPEFGVLYGDSYLAAPLDSVWAKFDGTKPAVLMTVYRNQGRWDASNAQLSEGLVVRYEKGLSDPAGAGMHHIDYGFSIIDRDKVMPRIDEGAVVDLADVYRYLSAERRVRAFEVVERFYEIGSPSGLAELEGLLQRTGPA